MSKKCGNPCATYNIPLNSNESDIFSNSCGRLYNFLHLHSNHGKSAECKPMMLKMHLELYDSAFMAEAEEEIHMESNDFCKSARETIQQLEIQIKTLQDALQAKDDFVKKLLDRIEKNNESINALLSSYSNATGQSVQLEKEIAVNKSIDRVEKVENNSIVNQAPDVDNNTTQDSNSNQQTYATAGKEQEHLDLRDNCVYIQRFRCTDSSLDTAFANVRKLADEMEAQIPENSIIRIEVIEGSAYYLDYLVYFRDANIKKEFLRNRLRYTYNRYGSSQLRILDYSNWGIVEMLKSKELGGGVFHISLETAFNEVIELAQKVGMKDIRKFIDHIDVSCAVRCKTIYSVRFNNERVKNEFLYNLKHIPEIKYKITDQGGHSLDCDNVNNLSVTIVGDNIIGVAALMGLSLTTDNFKRICILNPKVVGTFYNEFYISLMVEFSSKHMKNEFLKKNLEFEQFLNKSSYSFGDTSPFPIEISDTETDSNVIFIQYNKSWPNFSTAVSFIGMAKQLGLSLTRYQINRFIALSKLA